MTTSPAPVAAPESATPAGRLDWRAVLQLLEDDGVVAAADAERVRQRFAAGSSRLHALVRLAGAGLVHAATGRALDVEALTEWLAQRLGLPYLRIDPLKVDVARVADVMSVRYAESRGVLPVAVGAREITVATSEPFEADWVAEIESHTRKSVRRVLASPDELARYTAEFYTLAQRRRRSRASSNSSSLARATASSTRTTRASSRSSTGCGSTRSTSGRATSTSSRGATLARSASASMACCTPSTRCRPR